ncbi:MAG: flavin reductase family protein, partial [Gemmobacter sp.]
MNALIDIVSTAEPTAVTPHRFRDVLGAFATGVTIMTTRGPGGVRVGCTASSFNTVSLEPPLVLWSLGLRAASLGAFRAAEHFGVSILAE